jgi:predicted thioesterase
MKDSLAVGVSVTRRVIVDEARTIDFMGEHCRVYATPEVVRDIELTCRDLILEHADPGEDSVGIRVVLDHHAATLLGMWVDVTATVAEVDGRRVRFDLECRDQVEPVARGSHERFVVDVEKTAARLEAKAVRAAAAT